MIGPRLEADVDGDWAAGARGGVQRVGGVLIGSLSVSASGFLLKGAKLLQWRRLISLLSSSDPPAADERSLKAFHPEAASPSRPRGPVSLLVAPLSLICPSVLPSVRLASPPSFLRCVLGSSFRLLHHWGKSPRLKWILHFLCTSFCQVKNVQPVTDLNRFQVSDRCAATAAAFSGGALRLAELQVWDSLRSRRIAPGPGARSHRVFGRPRTDVALCGPACTAA